MQKVIDMRKSLEHGTRKGITGKELDELLEQAETYLKRLKKLFTQIDELKQKESIQYSYESAITAVRDTLIIEGVETVSEDKILKEFEKVLIDSGKVPSHTKRIFSEILDAKKHLDSGKITTDEIAKVRKEAGPFLKMLTEHIQRARGRELEKTRIRVKHGDKFGEVLLLENHAFVITDIDAKDREVQKAKLNADGSLGTVEKSTPEEFEQEIAKVKIPRKAFIKSIVFKDLERIFGPGVEVLMQN